MRYPIPHEKGIENAGPGAGAAVAAEMARVPGARFKDAMDRIMKARAAEVESITNLGPHAIEKLAAGGTMEVVYWEKEVGRELRELAGREYLDSATGQRFSIEISSPEPIRRDTLPNSGLGIPEHVEIVTQTTIRKVPSP